MTSLGLLAVLWSSRLQTASSDLGWGVQRKVGFESGRFIITGYLSRGEAEVHTGEGTR